MSRQLALPAGLEHLPLGPGTRCVVLAPHPDDESLAVGGLIQQIQACGTEVRVLQVTDGDDNPWPQRWQERRWWIRAADRRRWGERRAAEMLAAMQRLGLPAEARIRLGWPDMGVTGLLERSFLPSVAHLTAILVAQAPDLLVLPSLYDSHPDHSACHVLARLAMARMDRRPELLAYHVHGRRADPAPRIELRLEAPMQAAKRHAIEAHRSQLVWAGRSLPERARAIEIVHRLPREEACSPVGHEPLALPWQPSRLLRRGMRLSLVHAGGVARWPWHAAPLHRQDGRWWLDRPADVAPGPLFLKLCLRRSGLWIFDRWGWCDLTAANSARQA